MAGGGAGYGTNTTGEGPASPYGATAPDSTMSDNFGGSPTASPYTAAAPTDASLWASLTHPTGNLINDVYQHSLGRAPDAEGANFWANAAQSQGWNAQQLAQAIGAAGEPERARTGYQSDMNPSNYGQQRVGTAPSYYNTNPYSVDYANIFNPTARSVLSSNQVLTPGQQAQYLQDWQNDYSGRLNAGITGARQQRVANAQKAQENYNTKRAQAEAQAVASNKEAIDKAVQEALAQQQSYSGDSNSGWYTGASGGIASLAKGFKK